MFFFLGKLVYVFRNCVIQGFAQGHSAISSNDTILPTVGNLIYA